MENATRILRRQSEKEIIEYLAIVELKWKEIPKYGYDYYYR